MKQTFTTLSLTALLLMLTACGTPRAGLQAEYPPAQRSTFSLFADFAQVETLTPTLRWQTIGQVLMEKNERKLTLSELTDITFELRIWETATDYSGNLVYSRTGIKTPYHTLEEPLYPNSKFLWSVRAHFTTEGKKRISEWGMTGFLLQEEPVPNPSCFRFKTPQQKQLNSR